MSRTIRVLLVAAASAVLLAGCGGGDDESSDGASDTTTTTTTTASDDTTGDTTGGDTAGATFTTDECRQLVDSLDQNQINESLTDGEDPTAQLQAASELFPEAADSAPDEVRDDLEVMGTTYGDLAEAAAAVDWDGIRAGDPLAAAGAAQLGAIYSANPDFLTATTNVAAYIQTNCTVAE